MLTRNDVLSRAANDCMKELYSLAQPSVEWNEFVKENKVYSNKYKMWERFNHLYHKKDKTEKELEEYSNYPVAKWENKSKTECIGPCPFEFYYLPREVMKEVCDSYVYAYKMDSQQDLLDTIEVLKSYCKAPIVDRYIEGELQEDGTRWPEHRSYEHPNNLILELIKMLSSLEVDEQTFAKELQNKFFEFLDMAGRFFSWNNDLNSFNTCVYLGASPNSNKEAVIENWKKYRNQDIEIDESKYKEEEDYYDCY